MLTLLNAPPQHFPLTSRLVVRIAEHGAAPTGSLGPAHNAHVAHTRCSFPNVAIDQYPGGGGLHSTGSSSDATGVQNAGGEQTTHVAR